MYIPISLDGSDFIVYLMLLPFGILHKVKESCTAPISFIHDLCPLKLNLSTHPNIFVLALILAESMTISEPNIVVLLLYGISPPNPECQSPPKS